MKFSYIVVHKNKEYGVESDQALTHQNKLQIKKSILDNTWPNFEVTNETITKVYEKEHLDDGE